MVNNLTDMVYKGSGAWKMANSLAIDDKNVRDKE